MAGSSGTTRRTVIAWWRDPADYRWLIDTLQARGALPVVKVVVALAGLSLTALAAINWDLATGALRTVMIVEMVGGVVWAVLWTAMPWPGERVSLALMAGADLLIACGCLVDSSGYYGTISVAGLIAVGGYLTVFHGPRILMTHAAFSTLVALTMSWARLLGQDTSEARWSTLVTSLALVAGLLPTLHFCSWALRMHALSDPLTDLLNRRGLDYYVSRWFGPYDRKPITLMTIDIDRFKMVNDTLGHAEGDQVLIRVSDCLRAERPHGSVVARSGGEEFVVAAHLGAETAVREAERLRRAIETAVGPVTASIGVAVAEGGSPDRNLHDLLQASDSAMYSAKHSGGNTVSLRV